METQLETCALMHLPAMFKEDFRIFNTMTRLIKMGYIFFIASFLTCVLVQSFGTSSHADFVYFVRCIGIRSLNSWIKHYETERQKHLKAGMGGLCCFLLKFGTIISLVELI